MLWDRRRYSVIGRSTRRVLSFSTREVLRISLSRCWLAGFLFITALVCRRLWNSCHSGHCHDRHWRSPGHFFLLGLLARCLSVSLRRSSGFPREARACQTSRRSEQIAHSHAPAHLGHTVTKFSFLLNFWILVGVVGFILLIFVGRLYVSVICCRLWLLSKRPRNVLCCTMLAFGPFLFC